MFCQYCGKENRDGAKFCDGCGKNIAEYMAEAERINGDEEPGAGEIRTDVDALMQDNSANRSSGKDIPAVQKKSNNKLLLLIAVVAVLMLAVAVVFIVVISKSPEKKYEEQLKLAERYLQELDYDRAIAAYKEALEIDPKSEKAYLGLADAYVGKGELQAAIDILMEGIEKTDSVALKERLEELEKQFALEKPAEFAEPTPEPESEAVAGCNWRGGEWTNRDDILPYMNEEGYIVFGAYEQDGDESNGPEPIEWEVLEKNGNGTFLVSRYVLDCQPYNTEDTDVTWESCTLRSWLNSEFANKAFTTGEQTLIRITDVENPDHPQLGTPGGNNTKDRVFLLSANEVIFYNSFNLWEEEYQCGYSMGLIISPTEYAKKQGSHGHEITEEEYNERKTGLSTKNYSRDCIGCVGASWWLRSPAAPAIVSCVLDIGYAGWCYDGPPIYDPVGIRPALYIAE